MKPIRLIAMDMDGTLLGSDQRVSAGNVAALKAAQRKGVKLAICSGRAPGDNALFALENGLDQCAILSLNGAYCLPSPKEPPFSNHVMTGDTPVRCAELLRQSGLTFSAFLQNRIAVFAKEQDRDSFLWGSHKDEPGAPEYLYDWDAFQRLLAADGVNKYVCLEPDERLLQKLCQRLSALPGLDITYSWTGNRELMPRGVNKGTATRELAARMGIGLDEVMTLGDYDNDLPMIECAGLGVAMQNATDNVKRAAKAQTLSNDEDGVALAIERYVLRA